MISTIYVATYHVKNEKLGVDDVHTMIRGFQTRKDAADAIVRTVKGIIFAPRFKVGKTFANLPADDVDACREITAAYDLFEKYLRRSDIGVYACKSDDYVIKAHITMVGFRGSREREKDEVMHNKCRSCEECGKACKECVPPTIAAYDIRMNMDMER